MGGSQEPHLYEYNYIYIYMFVYRSSVWLGPALYSNKWHMQTTILGCNVKISENHQDPQKIVDFHVFSIFMNVSTTMIKYWV